MIDSEVVMQCFQSDYLKFFFTQQFCWQHVVHIPHVDEEDYQVEHGYLLRQQEEVAFKNDGFESQVSDHVVMHYEE